jgi:hypothetical protein
MPWVLIPGALRRLRNKLHLDWEAAAKATRLRVHTMRLHESKDAPRCLRLVTVEAYERGYECNRVEFVKWEDYGAANDKEGSSTPPAGTLQLRAEQERSQGGTGTITIRNETFELLGAVKLQRINTAFGLYKNERFGWTGRVTQQDYLPEIVARQLKIPLGDGALFRLERKIGKNAPIYITVFTTNIEHTRYLMDCADEKKPATVLVRVFVKLPEGDWKGFFVFEKPKRPRPFCFLVERVAL